MFVFVDLLHLHAFGEYWVRFSALYHDLLDRRFVITEELKSYVCETYHLPPDKFEVIYNGLDFSMPPTPSDHERLKRQVLTEFGFDAGKPIIGFCGRFPNKRTRCAGSTCSPSPRGSAPTVMGS